MNEENSWVDCVTPVFTFDWPRLRKDILIMDEKGEVYDPNEVAARPDGDRPAILATAFKEKKQCKWN